MKNNKINVNDILSPISNLYYDISEVRIQNLMYLDVFSEHINSYIDFDLFESDNMNQEIIFIKLQLNVSLNIDTKFVKETISEEGSETEIVYVSIESVFNANKNELDSENFQNVIVQTFLPEIVKRMRFYLLQITSFSKFRGYELPVINPMELLKKHYELNNYKKD